MKGKQKETLLVPRGQEIEMTVINTPLKKLDEIPMPTVKNHLRWAPMSVKLEYLRRSLMDLSKELKKEKEDG